MPSPPPQGRRQTRATRDRDAGVQRLARLARRPCATSAPCGASQERSARPPRCSSRLPARPRIGRRTPSYLTQRHMQEASADTPRRRPVQPPPHALAAVPDRVRALLRTTRRLDLGSPGARESRERHALERPRRVALSLCSMKQRWKARGSARAGPASRTATGTSGPRRRPPWARGCQLEMHLAHPDVIWRSACGAKGSTSRRAVPRMRASSPPSIEGHTSCDWDGVTGVCTLFA
jgi:hypothetical protein